MNRDVLLPGLRLQFREFGGDPLLRVWDWKLDPWTVSPDAPGSDGRTDLHIASTASPVEEPGPLSLLVREKTGFFERRVFRLPDGGVLWDFVRTAEERVYLRFRVSADWDRVTLLTDATGTQGSAALEYLGQIVPGACLKQGVLTFHGALVEYSGQAFAVCAGSGVGKTTHARLWRDCKRALILNGDRAVCRETDGVWTAYGTPWSGTSGEQINRAAPLRALVVLERGGRNEAARLTLPETLPAMLPHLLYPGWDRELTDRAMERLDSLLCAVPVIRLRCRPDAEAVDVLCRALEAL